MKAKKNVNGLLYTTTELTRSREDFNKIVTVTQKHVIPIREISDMRELIPDAARLATTEEAYQRGCRTLIIRKDSNFPIYAVETIDVLVARMNGTEAEAAE